MQKESEVWICGVNKVTSTSTLADRAPPQPCDRSTVHVSGVLHIDQTGRNKRPRYIFTVY